MSKIIVVAVHGINEDSMREFEAGLIALSHKVDVGIFVNERYIESFESVYDDFPDVYRFSIADDYDYNNCESLLLPYWFCDCSEEIFADNIKKITSIVDYCLSCSPKVELYIGTSLDQYEDFEEFNVTLPEVHNIVKEKIYEYRFSGFDPSLHFFFEHNTKA